MKMTNFEVWGWGVPFPTEENYINYNCFKCAYIISYFLTRYSFQDENNYKIERIFLS